MTTCILLLRNNTNMWCGTYIPLIPWKLWINWMNITLDNSDVSKEWLRLPTSMTDSHARQDWDDVYKRLVIVQLLKWLMDDMCKREAPFIYEVAFMFLQWRGWCWCIEFTLFSIIMTCQKNDYDVQPQWLAMLASDIHRDHRWTVEISSLSFTLKRTLNLLLF